MAAGAVTLAVLLVWTGLRMLRELGMHSPQYWSTLGTGVIWGIVIGAILGMVAGVIAGALHLPLFLAALLAAVFAVLAWRKVSLPAHP